MSASQMRTFADISTHTLLAERDRRDGLMPLLQHNFYSHAPRGA